MIIIFTKLLFFYLIIITIIKKTCSGNSQAGSTECFHISTKQLFGVYFKNSTGYAKKLHYIIFSLYKKTENSR
ncbi:hypothetical protein D0T84_03000 [Dysgonomonas sp. 521]|nr:hypothetical protein [Dysgonomonas sp. 521]